MDVAPGERVARVNPPGHVWTSAVDRRENNRLKNLRQAWRGLPVRSSARAAEREGLDVWQKFAYDVVMARARERVRRGEDTLAGFDPLRLILTGGAGSGKTRTVRAFLETLRRRLTRWLTR